MTTRAKVYGLITLPGKFREVVGGVWVMQTNQHTYLLARVQVPHFQDSDATQLIAVRFARFTKEPDEESDLLRPRAKLRQVFDVHSLILHYLPEPPGQMIHRMHPINDRDAMCVFMMCYCFGRFNPQTQHLRLILCSKKRWKSAILTVICIPHLTTGDCGKRWARVGSRWG